MRKPKYETNSKSEFSKAQNGHFAGFEHLNFGNSDLFGISILNSKKPRGLKPTLRSVEFCDWRFA